MHKPTRGEVRTGAGGLMFFSGTALLLLLTTTPPPGKYYPAWGFWLAALGIVAGLLTMLGTFIWPQKIGPSLLGVWRSQRRYRVTSEPSDGGRWPELLSVQRGISRPGSFTCVVETPEGPTFRTVFNDNASLVVRHFPNNFLVGKPVRPPKLPNGTYKVTWTVEERSKRFKARRTVHSSFIAKDRPRWERVHHETLPEDKGSVRLLWDGSTPIGLKCTVQHIETGLVYELEEQENVGRLEIEGGVGVLFPDAFYGPKPPPPGMFEATWLGLPPSFTGEMKDAWRPLIVDEFTWEP